MHFNCLFLCSPALSSKLDSRSCIKKASQLSLKGFVPQAGIEPARALRPTGFSYYYGFHHPTPVCSLDYAFTISFDLGAPCLVSTRSLSGFARHSHLKGFAEFTEFYIFNFSKCTQILVLQRTVSKSCVSTSSTTRASI